MTENCIFCKIINKEIPTRIEYENESCLAFHDINPRAKKHVLIIPKKHIPTVNDLVLEDQETMGALIMAAKEVSARLEMRSYRLLISVGKAAGQEIFHMHMHVMSPD